ncbi:MAG TPA: SGNH/GDSL hydrolase family protein [bacterium]|nr:SGNH/GDSL hydrolase family protein [bacterium]
MYRLYQKLALLLGVIFIFPGAQKVTGQPDRWESAIQAFEAQDEQNPPPEGAVLFAGSSSIRGWESLQQDFPFVQVIQRGFGGSEMEDLLYYADRIVLPYKPAVIIVYEGDNDIANGKSPDRVFADFRRFVEKVHAALPDTRIGYIAIKPSFARWNLIEEMAEANQMIREFTLWRSNLEYIDIFSSMLGLDGKPRKELLIEDGLHLTPAGYHLWTEMVTPYLQSAEITQTE